MLMLKQMLFSIIFILIIVWLGLAMLIYLFQSRFIYYPSKEVTLTPENIGMEFEDVHLTTRDNIAIHGWYVPRSGSRHTLLFLHGNTGNISDCLNSLKIFHDLGLSILIIDYRGYGLRGGSPGEAGTYLNAESAWGYLTSQRHQSAEDIIIFGRSLGGGIASWLALEYRPAALIMESTFTSITDMGMISYPYLPIKWLSRIRYPSIERIGQIRSPILIIHSPDDELVPYRLGQQLYERAQSPKSFLTIKGRHGDGFLDSAPHYIQGLGDFIQQLHERAKMTPVGS